MWSLLSWIYTSHMCHTGMDPAFADRNVWGSLARVEGAKTLVFTPRYSLPFSAGDFTEQEPLSLSLALSITACGH